MHNITGASFCYDNDINTNEKCEHSKGNIPYIYYEYSFIKRTLILDYRET